MPLISSKIHLELNWTKTCVLSTVGDNDNKTTFQITSTKFYVQLEIEQILCSNFMLPYQLKIMQTLQNN